MNSSILVLICVIIGVVSAFPSAQAPAAPAPPPPPPPGPFTTMLQAGGAVAQAQAQDLGKLFGIFTHAADSTLGLGQAAFGRFIAAAMGFAAGK